MAKRVVHLGRRAAQVAKGAAKHVGVRGGARGIVADAIVAGAKVVVGNVDRRRGALQQTYFLGGVSNNVIS